MERSKPLSYQSLKCVMQHIGAKFRIADAVHFPSLRNIQMMTPLRLNKLKLDGIDIELDDLRYSFTVYQEPLKQEDLSAYEQFKNSSLGHFHDLNPDKRVDTDFIIIRRERNRRNMQPELPQMYKYVKCDIKGDSFWFTTDPSLDAIEMPGVIQKHINKALNRVHQVNHLEFGPGPDIRAGYILRLPKGLKLKIRELTTSCTADSAIRAIRRFLDESSFPLQKLSIIARSPQDPVFQNEILRNSESLNIRIYKKNGWANLVMNLPNKEIHFSRKISIDEVFAIAKNWIENSRSIGSKFSMRSKSVLNHLKKVKSKLQAVEGHIPEKMCSEYPSCYSLPINPTSEMNFYGCESPHYDKPINGARYMFVMEVMPIGKFIPNNK